MHDTMQDPMEQYERDQQELREQLAHDEMERDAEEHRLPAVKGPQDGDIMTMRDGTRYRVNHRGWKRL